MILVVKPGMLASVQDLGRHGHRERGICPGGALDALALSLANRLVGNADGAAGLELTLGNCELRFECMTRMALTGDDFGATLDGLPVRANWSLPVRPGQTLRLGALNTGSSPKAGLRSWLAVAGGVDVPEILGSRSTDLKAGFGGHEGRALKKGDRLPLGRPSLDALQMAQRSFGLRGPAWAIDGPEDKAAADAISLRVMPGPEYAQFTAAAHRALWNDPWHITPQSNRMGSRLEGTALTRERTLDMLSSGVIPGTLQVPPSGQPIILMGDAQTTGGYPRIGVVIRADLWKLAQAPLKGRLRLVQVDGAEAQRAWLAQELYLRQVAQGLASAGWPVAATARAEHPRPSPHEAGEHDAD